MHTDLKKRTESGGSPGATLQGDVNSRHPEGHENILRLFGLPRKAFANEAEPLPNDFTVSGFTLTRDGDLFIPYGQYAHKKGMQHFTREGAQAMANAFVSPPSWVRKLWNWFTDAPLGVPIYVGHPDAPELAGQYPDKSAYGWANSLEPQADGLLVKVKWGAEGRAMIEDGRYRFFSPYWFGAPNSKGGWDINFMRSIGLTNTPNIPVPAIANDHDPATQPEPTKMNKKLLQLLGLAEDADETAFENAVTALHTEAVTLRTANTELTAKKTDAETALANTRTELSSAQAQTKAAREARATAAVDRLVTEARILPADRDAQVARISGLANETEITAELEKLSQEKPKLKTTAKSADAAKDKGRMLGASSERSVALANALELELEEVKKTISDPAQAYDAAWRRLRTKQPQLFQRSGAGAS